MKKWFGFLFLISLIVIVFDATKASAKDRPKIHDKYVHYVFLENETPADVLTRLGLFPVYGSRGALHRFHQLNPEFAWKYNNNENLSIVGEKVYLPILRRKGYQGWKAIVQRGQLFLVNADHQGGPQPHTDNLNLKNLVRLLEREKKAKRNVASNRFNQKDYHLGKPVIRVPLSKDDPIHRQLKGMGIKVHTKNDGNSTAFIEIPLKRKKFRGLASLGTSKAAFEKSSGISGGLALISASRQYSIKGSNGASGDIGIEPGFGLRGQLDWKESWLNLNLMAEIQTENFKQDISVPISQSTHYRYDLGLQQKFDLGPLFLGVGGGLGAVPSFVSRANNRIEAKHIAVPYGKVSLGREFLWNYDMAALWDISYQQYFPTSEGSYKLDGGFAIESRLLNYIEIKDQLYFQLGLQLRYQDDNPATYQQNNLGGQINAGVRWLLDEGAP